MKLSIKQVKNLAEQLKSQNDLIVSLRKKVLESEETLQMVLMYLANAEQHFEILDSYNFFKVTDLQMAIKSKKRDAVVIHFPAVADVDFLKKENEIRKKEIMDNILDDDRQDEIAAQIALRGDKIYAELSQTANNAQVTANEAAQSAFDARTAANDAQGSANLAAQLANQARERAEKGIRDAETANGMATKAQEKTQMVGTDLVALDAVVEYNFAQLEANGYLKQLATVITRELTMGQDAQASVPFDVFNGKKVTVSKTSTGEVYFTVTLGEAFTHSLPTGDIMVSYSPEQGIDLMNLGYGINITLTA